MALYKSVYYYTSDGWTNNQGETANLPEAAIENNQTESITCLMEATEASI